MPHLLMFAEAPKTAPAVGDRALTHKPTVDASYPNHNTVRIHFALATTVLSCTTSCQLISS